MKVSVYPKEVLEQMRAEGRLPNDTALICFDDADQMIGADAPAHADAMARVIMQAYADGKDIAVSCDRSVSAGCAAAVMEFFAHDGIAIFADARYAPDRAVYHMLLAALARQKRYFDNKYHYAADVSVMRAHFKRAQLSPALLEGYQPWDSHAVVDLKLTVEQQLSARGQLFQTPETIINALRSTGRPVYASFVPSDLHYLYFGWHPDGVATQFRYGCERIPVYIYFNKYYCNTADHRPPLYRRSLAAGSAIRLGTRPPFTTLSFFGSLSWDSKRRMIDAAPLIMTNMDR